MARRYREVRRLSPKKIFLVDFESVWRSEKGLPLCPIEVTVRDGNGDVIISCIINDEGVTNSAFEDALSDLGYSNEKSFQGVRRIRGPRQSRTSDPQSLYRHRPREKPAWPAESLLARRA